MKRSKIMALLLAFCLVLASCGKETEEFVCVQSFEYHFYPEEYEEKYSTFEKEVAIKTDTDYQFLLDADCEAGTMKICVIWKDGDQTTYTVDPDSPCGGGGFVPAGTSDIALFQIAIEKETKGQVAVDILARE